MIAALGLREQRMPEIPAKLAKICQAARMLQPAGRTDQGRSYELPRRRYYDNDALSERIGGSCCGLFAMRS